MGGSLLAIFLGQDGIVVEILHVTSFPNAKQGLVEVGQQCGLTQLWCLNTRYLSISDIRYGVFPYFIDYWPFMYPSDITIESYK